MNTSMRKLKRRLMTLKTILIPYNKKANKIVKIRKYEDEAETINEQLYNMRRTRWTKL